MENAAVPPPLDVYPCTDGYISDLNPETLENILANILGGSTKNV